MKMKDYRKMIREKAKQMGNPLYEKIDKIIYDVLACKEIIEYRDGRIVESKYYPCNKEGLVYAMNRMSVVIEGSYYPYEKEGKDKEG